MSVLVSQLDALAHRAQRQLLVELLQANPHDDTPVDSDDVEVEDEDVELLLDFQHFHLPELEEKGFVDYDRDTHTVTKGPDFEEIKPVLELIDEHRDELPDDWL